jgi:hypothetical protein
LALAFFYRINRIDSADKRWWDGVLIFSQGDLSEKTFIRSPLLASNSQGALRRHSGGFTVSGMEASQAPPARKAGERELKTLFVLRF